MIFLQKMTVIALLYLHRRGIYTLCNDVLWHASWITQPYTLFAFFSFSLLGIWTSLAQSIPAFLFSGYYASLSDRFGRKFILFIPVLGLTIYATVLLFIDVSHPQSFQVIVIVGSLISGCSGLYLVFIMGAYSYVSDATRFLVDDRKFAYSITQAAIVAPKIISPVIGGLLASEYGFAIPLCLIIGLGITAGICILIIPESLPVDSRARLKPLQFDVVKTFSNIKMLFTQKANAGTGTSPLGFVCSAFFLHFWCVVGNALLLVFYVKRRFGWSPSTIGLVFIPIIMSDITSV